jgi:hypothetical protein
VGILALSLLLGSILVPGLLQAAEQKPEWRIGSEFTYVQTWGNQTSEFTQKVTGSEKIGDNSCWKVEVKAGNTSSYAWYDKNTLGVWKISQESLGIVIVCTWSPQPANKILPIDNRSYDTKMKFELGGQPIGEMNVTYEITNKCLETVTVPAGTFEAYHLVIEQTTDSGGGQPSTTTLEAWYSTKPSNIVRETQELMGITITTELKSFKL